MMILAPARTRPARPGIGAPVVPFATQRALPVERRARGQVDLLSRQRSIAIQPRERRNYRQPGIIPIYTVIICGRRHFGGNHA